MLTRCRIFSSKSTRKRLAAGLRPDPLGELKRSPRHPSRKRGPTSNGRDGKGVGGVGREREGKGREGPLVLAYTLPPDVKSCIKPCLCIC